MNFLTQEPHKYKGKLQLGPKMSGVEVNLAQLDSTQ